MLPKKNRVDTKAVEKIFKEGKFLNSFNLTFKFIKTNNLTMPRVSFIVPKSVAKLAVKRSLLRRRGYIALEKYIEHLPSSIMGVFIFKKYQDDVSVLENEIKNTFNKIPPEASQVYK